MRERPSILLCRKTSGIAFRSDERGWWIDVVGYRYPNRIVDQRLVLSGLMMMSMMVLVVST